MRKEAKKFKTFWFGFATLSNYKIKGKMEWSGRRPSVSSSIP